MMLTLTRIHDRSFFDPFREMDQFRRSFFDGEGMMFNMDIADRGDRYEVSADLPGMNREDIHLDLNGDNLLTISAERRSEDRSDDNGYVRMERSFGSFCRTLDVSDVDVNGISAAYTDGVLKLNLPKKQPETPVSRRIEIQ